MVSSLDSYGNLPLELCGLCQGQGQGTEEVKLLNEIIMIPATPLYHISEVEHPSKTQNAISNASADNLLTKQ